MIKNKSRFSFIILPIIFLLVLVCAFSLRAPASISANAETTSLSGDGTKDSPKHITTIDDFLFLVERVNDVNSSEDYLNYYYALEIDLDLSNVEVVPIGTEERPFNGYFQGNGKIIDGFSINSTANNIGLFGYTGTNAVITSVGLVNSNITAYNSANAGGIVGYNQGTISNCFYQGTINARQNVGGIAGINLGSIVQCFSNGNVIASATVANLGGLVGQNHKTLQYSYSIADVESTNANAENVGGIIGGRYTSQVEATPTGTFFNGSLNAGMDSIGYGESSIDKTPVALDATRTQSLTREEFNTETLQKLFGNSKNWVRDAFTVTNHSSYVAPLQSVFNNRLKEEVNNSELKRNLETASSERMYGIDTTASSTEVWGSESNPYLISNETQLRNLQRAVSEKGESYFEKYFLQSSNVTLTEQMSPIGNRYLNNVFQGTYNGGNKTISGLEITDTMEEPNYLGLFGYIGASSTICNLTLDETCSIRGLESIGSFVGYNQGGTIRNVESRATVTAQGKSGGIVGLTREGVYENVLSQATLKLRGSNNGGLYGVIGGYQEKEARDIINVWYFVKLNETGFTDTNRMGSVLLVDTNNGNVTATKDNNGNIQFKQNSASQGFSVEYRSAEETTICNKETFEPTEYSNLPNAVYARFVKTVKYVLKNDANGSYVDSIAIFDEENNETNKLYSGQNFVLSIKILDSAYVRGILPMDTLSGIALKYKDSTGRETEPQYNYNGNNASVEYRATMQNDLDKLEIEITIINWSEEVFSKDHVYDGEPVEFPIEKLEKPANYSIIVNYSGGSAPVRANQSASENHSYTIIYQNESGIRMGSKNGNIHINKCQLYVPLDALQNTKEWDDSDLPSVAKVDNTKVYFKVNNEDTLIGTRNDVVQVNATMSFGLNDIQYDSLGNYVKTTIKYIFTLSGKDATNYLAPTEANGTGTIVRRQIKVSLDSYEGQFSGVGKKPSLSGKKIIASGVIASKPYEAIYTFLSAEGVDIKNEATYGSVGYYRLLISLSDESKKYYEISFLDAISEENGAYTYVNYKVVPYKTDLIYLINGENKDNVTYDGTSHTVSAYFYDVSGKRVDVSSLAIADNNGDTVTNLLNAGEYVVNASYSDANYDLSASNVKTLIVNKAEQQEITFTSSATHDFGSTYIATAIGGSGEGDIVYSVSEDCLDMATFEGNVLTINKAGVITIIATKHDESGNYNDLSKNFDLTVNKTEISVCVQSFEITYLDEPTFSFVSSTGEELDGVSGVNVILNGNLYSGEVLDFGSYEITLSLDDNAESDGYILQVGECGTLTVKKLAIMVTAENKEGVYGEQLKELTYSISDSRVSALNGELTTTARNVGENDILQGTITEENNSNFEITFVPAKYTITPKALIVKAIAQEKRYGEADPVPAYEVEGLAYDDTAKSINLTVNMSRFSGEDSYIENVEAYSSYQYRLIDDITMDSDNYTVSFVTASLTIIPGTPTIDSCEVVNVLPDTKLNDENKPNLVIKGRVYENSVWSEKTLDGTVQWKESLTPNFSNSASLTFVAIFTPNNKNYAPLEVDVEVKVIPVELTVRFVSPKQIVYDGNEHDDVEYELVGLIEGLDAKEKVTYDGDVKNVGNFSVKVVINNHNYKLAGSGETTIKITKADLLIKVEDLTIVEDEEAKIDYLFVGFQKGDDADCLTKQPSVQLSNVPGTYTITPSGAKADNYNIKYESFTFKVLTKSIINDEDGLSLKGEFDSETKFEMVESTSNVDINNKFAEVQEGYKALENMGIDKVYDLKYSVGEQSITIEGSVYLTMAIPEGYEDTKLAYAILTNNGEVVYVQDVLYDGDKVTINVTNAKALMLLTEQEDNSFMLYVAIGAVVVVVVVIILIVRAVKKRREARYVKYED
ncbi:MAG: hypothetical protein IJD50_01045 [Clostridia bacterium]|nr:hypothetical protein [Clostridia bacterium]